MNIVLKRNASPANQAVKSLTTVTTLSGTMRNGADVTNPVILIESSTIPSFNYFTIEAFGRSYFLTNLVSVNDGLWEIHGHCDVLSSFWSEIKNCECIINRSSSNRNPLLIDKQLWVTARSRYGTIKSQYQPLLGGTATKRFVMVLPGSGTGTTPT